jgi:hypothetical protein
VLPQGTRVLLVVVDVAALEDTTSLQKVGVEALVAAIAADGIAPEAIQIVDGSVVDGSVVEAIAGVHDASPILCPLTFNLPKALVFPGLEIFSQCQNIEAVRQQVVSWEIATGDGTYWLPIVLTAKGPLYAEAIAQSDLAPSELAESAVKAPSIQKSPYIQPFHLADVQRQPLYSLALRLLKTLNAPPAVYLMQFGMDDRHYWFDRLIPFPDQPAIASLNTQTPDLFTCHWRCLTGQPIRELMI